MLTLGPHPRPTESETVGWAEQSALTSSPGDCVHGKGGRPLEKEAFGVWSQLLLLIIHVITVLFISLAGQGEVPVQRSADLLGANAQPGFLLSPPHPEHPSPHQLQPDAVLSASHPGDPPWGPDAQGGRCKGTRSGEDKSVGLERRGAGRGRIPRHPRSPYAPRRV